MVPTHEMISQLPSGRLNTPSYFYHRKGSIWFLLEQTLWISICLTCIQGFCQIYHAWPYRIPCLVIHTALLLITNSPISTWIITMDSKLMIFTGLTNLPSTMTQLVDRVMKWTSESCYNIKYVAKYSVDLQ